jgi:hypothetical protein
MWYQESLFGMSIIKDPKSMAEVYRFAACPGENPYHAPVIKDLGGMRLRLEQLRQRGRAKAGAGSAEEEAEQPAADWLGVQDRLLFLYEQGERYTSQRDFATRFGCSVATVNKAINASPKLRGWQARYAKRKSSPRAQSLNDVVTDNTPTPGEPDPSEVLPDDDVDAVMAQLIDQAKPDERAMLNALDADDRRQIAQAFVEQQKDDRISNSGSERSDPQYRYPHLRGNRLLGRKP